MNVTGEREEGNTMSTFLDTVDSGVIPRAQDHGKKPTGEEEEKRSVFSHVLLQLFARHPGMIFGRPGM